MPSDLLHLHGDTLRRRIAGNLRGFERRALPDGGLKRAAVAVVLVAQDAGGGAILITRRAARLRGHAGQWALPGGRSEAGEDAVATALRELHEELGLRPGPSAVLGLLDDYPTRSGYLITPVVLWPQAAEEAVPHADEVASLHHLDLGELDRPQAMQTYAIPETERPIIYLDVMGADIHAPTAAVLYQFREVGLQGRPTRVAHFDQPVWAWR